MIEIDCDTLLLCRLEQMFLQLITPHDGNALVRHFNFAEINIGENFVAFARDDAVRYGDHLRAKRFQQAQRGQHSLTVAVNHQAAADPGKIRGLLENFCLKAELMRCERCDKSSGASTNDDNRLCIFPFGSHKSYPVLAQIIFKSCSPSMINLPSHRDGRWACCVFVPLQSALRIVLQVSSRTE